jgi:hypothetical protein
MKAKSTLPTQLDQGAAYAPYDQDAETLAECSGDDRTPDKKIGEIKYAERPVEKAGQTTDRVRGRAPDIAA